MGLEELVIEGKSLDINTIQKILPHRYPFLLVDRILESGGNKIVGIKNVTINEPFFQGHFPGHPIMPGVLIIEAMAQVGGVGALSMSVNRGKLAYFLTIDNARFRKPVVPGDVLRMEVDLLKSKMGMVKTHGVAKVDNEVVAEADMMFAFINPDEIK
ncbi:MAG: 3-hydroxyacyl-ACP dehydratase FabZ [Candidatus Omnitrophica bacterium]|nr:3-hydroxyacyl-ACP dehydratase FabZ [Candidatus Omnitrophota bacterium]MDD5436749.1 3-hydroxyacyl-ACP dehydratase FabZ [Candidatus Omnitrophota bacterium]